MNITLEELRRYRAYKACIISLDAEIETAYHAVSSPSIDPVVSGRTSVRPSGTPTESAVHRIDALRERRDGYEERMKAIELYIDTMQDLTAQSICRLHFLAGKSWRQTARSIYGIYGEGDTCRKYVHRYFKKK